MKNTQKRAFILSECKSPYISQAIFILKDGVTGNHCGVIADAERIVASYMSASSNLPKNNKKELSAPMISAISSLITIAVSVGIFLILK